MHFIEKRLSKKNQKDFIEFADSIYNYFDWFLFDFNFFLNFLHFFQLILQLKLKKVFCAASVKFEIEFHVVNRMK